MRVFLLGLNGTFESSMFEFIMSEFDSPIFIYSISFRIGENSFKAIGKNDFLSKKPTTR